MTYAVTGSTGGFGGLAITHLMNMGVAPSSIIALARNESKTGDLKARGVDVRLGDYEDRASLEKAFAGVDRLLLVSGSEIGSRLPQHKNVIDAAKSAGVKQIVYTSITRADTSSNPLAAEHKATEEVLKSSGLDFVILRNNWYVENYAADVRFAGESGLIAAATGKGRVASATKSDYAEAAARVLLSDGLSGNTYELAGSPWSYDRLAGAASQALGREVAFQEISTEARTKNLVQAGLPEDTAGFFAKVDESIAAGSLDVESDDLAQLLGRKPQSLEEAVKSFV